MPIIFFSFSPQLLTSLCCHYLSCPAQLCSCWLLGSIFSNLPAYSGLLVVCPYLEYQQHSAHDHGQELGSEGLWGSGWSGTLPPSCSMQSTAILSLFFLCLYCNSNSVLCLSRVVSGGLFWAMILWPSVLSILGLRVFLST